MTAASCLRDWTPQLLAAPDPVRPARSHSGLAEEAIWEWGYLERVSSGLHLLDLREAEQAAAFLTVAERLL